MKTSITYTLEDIDYAAAELLAAFPHCRIFAFSGTLGAGKTTFINALCRQMQVEDAVSSPTFSLVNEYRFEKDGKEQVIYHMDWYRLRDVEEAVNAGMEDCLMRKGVWCFVEWPEQAPELLSMSHAYIMLEAEGEQERMLNATLDP